MSGASPNVLMLFTAAVATQLVGIGLLPRTAGFTDILATTLCIVSLTISFGLISRMLHGGSNLSILAPLMSAIIPFGASVIGILAYGERASLPRMGLLFGACAMIGIASRVS